MNLLLLVVSTSIPLLMSQSAPSSQNPLKYIENGSSLAVSELRNFMISISLLISEIGMLSTLDLLSDRVSRKA